MTLTEAPVACKVQPRPRWARGRLPFFAAALLLCVPCIWQAHIQSSDLPSHLYNAWIANQVAAGALKGLSVAPQTTNVLFDLLLSRLLGIFSAAATEHIAAIAAVQVFFWGSFALVSAIGGKPAWDRAPWLVLLAYGSVFRLGFFNFYIAVGICCAAIALIWRNHWRMRWLALPMLVVAYIAHSLPCLWALAMIAYIIAARIVAPPRRRWCLAAGLMGLAAAAVFLGLRVPSAWLSGGRVDAFFGADQVITFGAKYQILAAALLCYSILLLVRLWELRSAPQNDVALHLWLMTAIAALALPNALSLPWYSGGLTFISIRLSLLSAILLCASAARVPVKKWESVFQFVLLLVFLLFTYADERSLNSVEQQVATAIASLPPGARVISTLKDSRLYISALEHVADRPCIGRCFDFADYEPATGQFRIHAERGNSLVFSDEREINDLEHRQLVFTRTDIVLYRLFPCRLGRNVCAERVSPGQTLAKVEIPPL